MSRPCGLTDKVNSIGNSALYCSKKFKGNSKELHDSTSHQSETAAHPRCIPLMCVLLLPITLNHPKI